MGSFRGRAFQGEIPLVKPLPEIMLSEFKEEKDSQHAWILMRGTNSFTSGAKSHEASEAVQRLECCSKCDREPIENCKEERGMA